MARSSGGMLAISNTKPDSITAGRNAAISAAWAALNWLRITVERNSPSPRALPRKTLVTRKSSSREPRQGTPITATEKSRQSSMAMMPRP